MRLVVVVAVIVVVVIVAVVVIVVEVIVVEEEVVVVVVVEVIFQLLSCSRTTHTIIKCLNYRNLYFHCSMREPTFITIPTCSILIVTARTVIRDR